MYKRLIWGTIIIICFGSFLACGQPASQQLDEGESKTNLSELKEETFKPVEEYEAKVSMGSEEVGDVEDEETALEEEAVEEEASKGSETEEEIEEPPS
jgi:hypothetical protein